MTELVQFEIKNMPPMKVVGKIIHVTREQMTNNPIPAFWEQCMKEQIFRQLEQKSDQLIDPAYVGWMGNWTPDYSSFDYICGMLTGPDYPLPEGFIEHQLAATEAAVGWIRGPEKETYATAHNLTEKAMQEKGYRYITVDPWSMELYNCPRFTTPQPNGDIILDYYIACTRDVR